MNGKAFIMGYEHVIKDAISCSSISGVFIANKSTILKTPREVCDKFPDFTCAQVDAFLNGVDDALSGDSFRYRAVKACQNALPILNKLTNSAETLSHYPEADVCFNEVKNVLYGDK